MNQEHEKINYYAVKKGRKPGIYTSWRECELQTKGFPFPKYRKFSTWEDANDYLKSTDVSTKSIYKGWKE